MSKFWTWNGSRDRKQDPSGLAPLPIEYTKIHGMEHGRDRRSSKLSRKPIPLVFDPSNELQSRSSSRSNDTIALHDAAIKSATSLMAVMNDCLNSPQLSAHLLAAQQHSAGLKPMYNRPRSHTAPSTPMVEASCREPVELEGSTPIWPQSSIRPSLDVHYARSATARGNSIARPHSSPQDSSYKMPVYPQHSFERSASNPYLSSRPVGELQAYNCTAPAGSQTVTTAILGGETLVASNRDRLRAASQKREPESRSKRLLDLQSRPQLETKNQSIDWQPPVQAQRAQKDSKTELQFVPAHDSLEHIMAIRASHEAHSASLKEAHDKELASHRTYIQLLESQRKVLQASQLVDGCSRKHLTLDTNRSTGRNSGTVYSDTSATASVNSFEQSLEYHKRTSTEMAAELEALKRKLSLCRRSQADLGDVRGERDGLRDMAANNDRRIAQLKDIVRKAKENEKTLKARMQGLEASLETANMERIDVLEGFYEACEQVDKIAKRERALVEQRETLKPDPINAPQVAICDIPYDATHRGLPPRESVEKLVERYEQQTAVLKAECDQYNTLLHVELRRQARSNGYRTDAVTPQIEHEAAAAITQKLNLIASTTDRGCAEDDKDSKVKQLEQELQHCYQEIIMYKLDVRGYKKDLKILQADNEALRSQSSATSSRDRDIGTPAAHSYRHGSIDRSAGLGILLVDPPKTPPSTVPSAIASAPLPAPTTPTPASHLASPLRPVTPLGKHKKLPKPPPHSRTPSPRTGPLPRVSTLQRQETMRSLSESIISSYAKRETPEKETHIRPPVPTTTARGRRSAPPPWRTPTYIDRVTEGREATVVSMRKISGEALKTPSMAFAVEGS